MDGRGKLNRMVCTGKLLKQTAQNMIFSSLHLACNEMPTISVSLIRGRCYASLAPLAPRCLEKALPEESGVPLAS